MQVQIFFLSHFLFENEWKVVRFSYEDTSTGFIRHFSPLHVMLDGCYVEQKGFVDLGVREADLVTGSTLSLLTPIPILSRRAGSATPLSPLNQMCYDFSSI